MGILRRFKDWGHVDEYRVSTSDILEYVRKYCRRKYGDDQDVLYRQVGKRLQYHIDAMNNQGGLNAHRHALARWQVFKALYPEYISDERPRLVAKIWLNLDL